MQRLSASRSSPTASLRFPARDESAHPDQANLQNTNRARSVFFERVCALFRCILTVDQVSSVALFDLLVECSDNMSRSALFDGLVCESAILDRITVFVVKAHSYELFFRHSAEDATIDSAGMKTVSLQTFAAELVLKSDGEQAVCSF